MFCPQCATENEVRLSYCRSCGLSLVAVRLSLEGRVDEGTAVLSRAQKPLLISLIALAIFCLITVLTLLTGGSFGWANAVSAIGFLVITLPFAIFGALRVRRANQLLLSNSRMNPLKAGVGSAGTLAPPASATENTTRELKSRTGDKL